MGNDQVSPSHYEILQVHPSAPLDLITAAYWRLADQAQVARSRDSSADVGLYHLTRAYQVLADAASRSAYDSSIGLTGQSAAPRLPRMRPPSFIRRIFTRSPNRLSDPAVDYYEVLRVHPRAEASLLAEAYAVMRNYYLRLVRLGKEPPELLDLLEEAYAATSDPARRRDCDSPLKLPSEAAKEEGIAARTAPRDVTPAREYRKQPNRRQQPRRRRSQARTARTSSARGKWMAPAALRSLRTIGHLAGGALGYLTSRARRSGRTSGRPAWRFWGNLMSGGRKLALRAPKYASATTQAMIPLVKRALMTGARGQNREIVPRREEEALLARLAVTPKSIPGSPGASAASPPKKVRDAGSANSGRRSRRR